MSQILIPDAELYAGSYLLTERLGTGGTGTVYRARHVALQQERAVKILHPRRGTSAQEPLTQLQLEASVFGRLKGNPSIVMPFNIGFDRPSQTHHLAMELLSGCDLGRWVNAEGPLTVSRTLSLMRQISSGLDAAHGYVDPQGRTTPIVHRDLSPSNLFIVEPRSPSPHAKILDFGLAAVLDRTNVAPQQRTGTALFRAYEQANALELVPQTDIWALGLVVHFALTGHHYWRQRNAQELLNEITAAPLDAPSIRLRERVPDAKLPEEFDTWLLRCLQRIPARRFATAGEAIDELDACLAQAGVDPSEPLLLQGHAVSASTWVPHSRSHSRSVAATDVAESGSVSSGSPQANDGLTSPVLQLAQRFHPLLRNVLRVSDDLMTATGHYLAFPPETLGMLERQLDGVTHHVAQYNEARDLLRRELGAYEGLLRNLHQVAPHKLYEAASEALAMALVFSERFPIPAPPQPDEVLAGFTRECTYWQAERVMLHAQLEVGRMRVRALEEQVIEAGSALDVSDESQHQQALRGAELLERYTDETNRLERSVRAWLAEPAAGAAERKARTWAMAPPINAMNAAYAEIDNAALALRLTLSQSQVPFHRRVSSVISSVHDFQWYEFRPLLNGPLVQVIRFLCCDSETTMGNAFDEDRLRWLRLARTLERARQRFRPQGARSK